ncbi:MAG: CPXCG motif-containing cysteine-rich protein [Bacteroidetes bacterium QS_9_68_14]|nr:MAG: CPXCG motif-containing cysteine-rich protein [Bacteroidetes bacterium QS_9_68_14]
MHEHTFTCPHCWEQISMLLDLSVFEQTYIEDCEVCYIEDCEVCCRPIRIHYTARRGALEAFDAQPAQ